jgi:hypothetical protein
MVAGGYGVGDECGMNEPGCSHGVIPAKAGIQCAGVAHANDVSDLSGGLVGAVRGSEASEHWIPAFAGMTAVGGVARC